MSRLRLLAFAAAAVTAALAANPVFAQAGVDLCDAPWMDAERVRALLAVEFGGGNVAHEIRVLACTDESAEVVVRFGAAPASARVSQLDLRQTPAGARSRLVALVIAELVRLDSPEVTREPPTVGDAGEAPAPDPVSPDPVSPGEGMPQPPATQRPASHEEDTLAVELSAAADSPPDEESVAAVAGESESTSDTSDETATRSTLEENSALAGEGLPDSEYCDDWRRFGRGRCSWSVGLSYGVGFHQLGLLGRFREGSTFNHQLRLVARWRFLFAGVRVYGSGATGPADIIAGGATAIAGLEWWARRWSKNILALRTGIEAGVQGFHRGTTDEFCDFDCAEYGEPVVGAFTSVRFERLFGLLRGAVELELGWSTGFRIDDEQELVAGLGGPWFSLAVELSLGRED